MCAARGNLRATPPLSPPPAALFSVYFLLSAHPNLGMQVTIELKSDAEVTGVIRAVGAKMDVTLLDAIFKKVYSVGPQHPSELFQF